MNEDDSKTEAVRLADEEVERVTGQVKADRLEDATPERRLTADKVRTDRRDDQQQVTDQIQKDRRDDQQQVTDQIQRDRRDDEAPRTALELVRADRLTRSIMLQESIRKLCLALLFVMTLLAAGGAFMFDYLADSRSQVSTLTDDIKDTRVAADDMQRSFDEFTAANQQIASNHERTQRILCAWFRTNNLPPPENGDCDNR